MRYARMFLLLSGLAQVDGHLCIAQTPALSWDEIKAGIQQRGAALRSFEAQFELRIFDQPVAQGSKVETVKGQALVMRQHYLSKLSDEKIYVSRDTSDSATGQKTRTEIGTWDGMQRRAYNTNPSQADARLHAVIGQDKGPTFSSFYWQTPVERQIFDIDAPLWELVTIPEIQWRVVGQEQVGEYGTYHIQSLEPINGHMTLDIWVSPEQDFAPVQIRSQQLLSKLGAAQDASLFMENARLDRIDGVWVIVSADYGVDNPNVIDPVRNVDGKLHYRYSLTSYKRGIEFPPDTFFLSFPKGTWLYDEITGVAQIVGEKVFLSSDVAEIAAAEALGNSDVGVVNESSKSVMANQPTPKKPGPSSGLAGLTDATRPWIVAIMAGGVACLTLVVARWVRMRYKQR